MRLWTFAAEPEPVTLGGRDFLAPKLRVIDVARLEGWMGSAVAPPPPGDPLAASWPPAIESRAGLALLSSGEGVARVILASLGQSASPPTVAEARDLSASMDDGEVAALFAAVFPRADHSRGGSGRRPGRPGPANWVPRIVTMARAYGYPPDVVLRLPLDQFFAMEADPSWEEAPSPWQIPVATPADLDRLWRERQAAKGQA